MFDAVELIGKIANKMIPKRFFDKPLPQQVDIQRGLMDNPLMGNSREERLINVRSFLLKDSGLPTDIKDLLKKGKSGDEVKDFYWSCEEFRLFWADLDMEEGMLDELIRAALEKVKVKV